MIKKTIKQILRSLGISIVQSKNVRHPLGFLTQYDINTVLDIGANIGEFSKEARHILPNAYIYAFEPIEECMQKLKNTMAKDTKFKAFQFALGDKEEDTVIHKSEYAPSSSIKQMATLHKEAFPHTKSSTDEKISIKKLDDIAKDIALEKNILIKIDVQGYEEKVIQGGIDTLSKAKVVLIENSFVELYQGQWLFEDLYQEMRRLGFKYQGSIGQKHHPKTGEILFEDSIFIRD